MLIHNPKDRSKAFKRAFENARRLIRELEAGLQPVSTFTTNSYDFSIRGLGGMSLTREEAVNYFNCVNELHDSLPNKQYYDLKTVIGIVNEAILKSLDLLEHQPTIPFKKRLNSALEELASVLHKSPDTWEVHYAVEGVSLKRLPISIGKIELYSANKRGIEHLSDRVEHIYKKTHHPEDQQQEFAKSVKEDLRKYFYRKVIAKVIVRSVTADAARSQALKELRSTLDVLNFFADTLHPPGIAARAYLPGEALRSGTFSPAFRLAASADEYTAIYPSLYTVGPLSYLELSRSRLRKLSKFGFNRISAILSKEESERSKLERRILSAFQWAGRATLVDLSNKKYKEETDSRREEAFLLYTISLESLLLKEEKVDNTNKFKTRGAALLAGNAATSKRVEKHLSDLYDTRSRIVHDGNIDVSDEDLYYIRVYAKRALTIVLLSKKFQNMRTEEEFIKWLERKPH
jgi:hypothetical protein